LETRCPNCQGQGRVVAGMHRATPSSNVPSAGDVLLFCVTTALVWAFAGFLTMMVVYHTSDVGLALNQGGPYRLSLLRRIVTGWGIVGIILGRVMLWDFTK